MKQFCRLFLLFISFAATMPTFAQWPQRAVRIVVAAPGGSSVDIVARLIAAELRPRLGRELIDAVHRNHSQVGNSSKLTPWRASHDINGWKGA